MHALPQVDKLPEVEVIVAPPRVKLTPQMLLNLPDLRILLGACFDRPDFRASHGLKAINMGHVRLQGLCLLESVGPDFPGQLELPALSVLILKHIKVGSSNLAFSVFFCKQPTHEATDDLLGVLTIIERHGVHHSCSTTAIAVQDHHPLEMLETEN